MRISSILLCTVVTDCSSLDRVRVRDVYEGNVTPDSSSFLKNTAGCLVFRYGVPRVVESQVPRIHHSIFLRFSFRTETVDLEDCRFVL